MEPGHWPSLVQKAAAAAESAQHAEVTGTGERRGLSKSSLEDGRGDILYSFQGCCAAYVQRLNWHRHGS